ncbi:MAG: NADH-quinone oxidoreductase subunit J [Candidatus Micrarchaeota archaeon]|nr:NADH-quinone oxidoreductase subunit J [Candidatus Micrarchaeota archaeon]
MKNLKIFYLIVVFYLFSVSEPNQLQSDFSKFVGLQIDSNYPALSLILSNFSTFLILFLAFAIIFLVLGYFGASFFDLADVKALIKTEIGQLFITSFLVAVILGSILALDSLIISSSNYLVSPCPENYVYDKNIPRYIEYSNCYLDNLIKLADSALRATLEESIRLGRDTFFNRGFQMNIYFLAYSETSRPGAYKRLDVEIKTTEGQFLSSFLISLMAQKTFLNFIAPVFGPFLILLGVLFRTFFFTRKIGGLFIAIGLGLFLIWPLTYLISWFTFRGAIFSSQLSEQEVPFCPKECNLNPPLAYNSSLNPAGEYNPSSFIGYFDFIKLLEEKEKDPNNKNKNLFEYLLSKGIQPCYVEDEDKNKVFGKIKVADSLNCPDNCRLLPTNLQACNETACNNLPNACKFIRAMGLENYTSYYEPNQKYCTQPSACSNCPSSCKYGLKEIKYSSSAFPLDQNSKGIKPKLDPYKCSDKCANCPSVCRVYTKLEDGTKELLFKDKVECKDCKACFEYMDSEGEPICMVYSPLEAAGTCNELCGLPNSIRNLKDVEDKFANSICPIDCRLYFDANSEKYKDPIFSKYCENGKFKEACNRCPKICKINVSSYIQEIQASAAECSLPPTFISGKMADEVSKNCARCPPSCRFLNPSSIAKKAIEQNQPLFAAFYSKTFLVTICGFDPNRYISCSYDQQLGYYINCQGNNLYEGTKIPSASPVATAYQTLKSSEYSFCPDFIARDDRFVFTQSWSDSENKVNARPNPFTSLDCTIDKDALTFCSSNYCPSECFFKSWPKFATLLSISNPYSKINFNLSNCGFEPSTLSFYDQNHTLLVILNYSSSYYLPAGVDSSYFPSLGEINTNLEKFACYPILIIPSRSQSGFESCGPYIESNSKDRAMANASACPYSCRYDELQKLNLAQCGNFTLSFTSSNPAHNCEPFCKGLIRTSDLSYCEAEAYSCNQLQANNYWIRISSITINKSHSNPLCNQSVVLYNSTTYRAGDRKQDGTQAQNDWWVDYCSYFEGGRRYYINFTLVQNYQPYNCTPYSKYAGLDQLIAQSGHPNYRECGEINTTANPNYIFCGNYTISYGGRQWTIFAVDKNCYASYNARAMPGLSFHNVFDGDFSTKSSDGKIKQKISVEDNCQLCPIVYRIVGLDITKGLSYFILQGLNCNKCLIKVQPVQSNKCVFEQKKARACPIRCRFDPSLLGGRLSYGCDVEGSEKDSSELIDLVGYSCDDFHSSGCRISNIETDPCFGCFESCESDCRYLPYIRQNCDSCSEGGLGLSDILSFTSSAEGLYTQSGWIRIGLLLIPSIILPSFSIVILLSFIRSLSPFLGGDIEIAGLYKLI